MSSLLPAPPSPDSSEDDEPKLGQQSDLRAVWEASRMARAQRLYAVLMPRLIAAASEGLPGVRLQDGNIVREARLVLDVVANLLFAHGVYRCALVEDCLHVDFAPASERTELYNPAWIKYGLK